VKYCGGLPARRRSSISVLAAAARESNSGQSSRESNTLTTEPPYNVSPCDLVPRRPVLCFWSSVTVRCCALSRPRWVSQQDEPETILSSGRLEGRATGTVISLDGLANGRNELVDDELDSSVVDVCSDSPSCHVGNNSFQRSELKPNSITLASSELAPNMFGASSELAPNRFGASSELVWSWLEAEIWPII